MVIRRVDSMHHMVHCDRPEGVVKDGTEVFPSKHKATAGSERKRSRYGIESRATGPALLTHRLVPLWDGDNALMAEYS